MLKWPLWGPKLGLTWVFNIAHPNPNNHINEICYHSPLKSRISHEWDIVKIKSLNEKKWNLKCISPVLHVTLCNLICECFIFIFLNHTVTIAHKFYLYYFCNFYTYLEIRTRDLQISEPWRFHNTTEANVFFVQYFWTLTLKAKHFAVLSYIVCASLSN